MRESAKMMLRVDPTLELSAASIDDLDWNINLLRAAGRYLDWISIHSYWDFTPDGVTYQDYNTVMLRTGEDISGSPQPFRRPRWCRRRARSQSCGRASRIRPCRIR